MDCIHQLRLRGDMISARASVTLAIGVHAAMHAIPFDGCFSSLSLQQQSPKKKKRWTSWVHPGNMPGMQNTCKPPSTARFSPSLIRGNTFELEKGGINFGPLLTAPNLKISSTIPNSPWSQPSVSAVQT